MIKDMKNKIGIFWGIFTLIIVATIIAISLGLSFLWNMLIEYENSTTTYALKQFEQQLIQEDTSAFTTTSSTISQYEDPQIYEQLIKESISNKELRFVRVATQSEENMQNYAIKSGDEILGEMALAFVDEGTFGHYEVQNAEIYVEQWGDISLRIPQHATLFVNDIEVLKNEAYLTDIAYEELESLPDSIAQPTVNEYKITGLYKEPKIKVIDMNGSPYLVNYHDEIPWDSTEEQNMNYATITLSEPVGDLEEYSDMALTDAKSYSYYLSQDGSFSKIGNRMIREADVYDNVRLIDTAFYTNHTSVEISDEVVSNIVSYSDTIFSIDVDYLYTVYRGTRPYPFDTKLTIVYVNIDGDWMIGDIQIR